MSEYVVGQVAALTGVTIRTLHHYEAVGLLIPSARSTAGYRQYDRGDLDRLRHILYRELGFSLDAIGEMLDEPASTDAHTTDTTTHLRRQRQLLGDRIDRLTAMRMAVEKELEAQIVGTNLSPEEKFELFGPNYSDDYEQEAQQRWGDTPQWQQSAERTAAYTKQDWRAVKAEGEALNAKLGAAFRDGAAATGARAMDLAEDHRQTIARFYDCPYAMHRGLADMYVADERFRATYEAVAPGLTDWLRAAIHANADRHDQP